ncbi:MAG: DNA cytosine methyltransferase [Iphinoe sp. HA4291-MV1]|jgi:site-specific DNA-cytosine methylase|nr:DNA cytosine methyltransferase [Iphinoe sp. HA4291-MV1]
MKPTLLEDAPIAVDFFSCAGGVKAGMVAAGVRPIVGIEKDPDNEGLSHAYNWIQSINFGEYGSVLHIRSIQEMSAANFPEIPRNPFILHASPSCKNYSNAKNLKSAHGETLEDISAGEACARGIEILKPQYFTLECVPNYQKGLAYDAIARVLHLGGYIVVSNNIDVADYGVPQNRNRLFILASLPHSLVMRFPPKLSRIAWRDAIAGLNLKKSTLTEKQQRRLQEYLAINHEEDLLIERIGASTRKLIIRTSVEPCWTITASIFSDDKGASRNHTISTLIDGEVYALSMRAIARLCGFFDWYTLPEQTSLAGTILGNAVPPAFYAYLLRYNFPTLNTTNR